MLGRGIIWAGVLIYAAVVLGCMLQSNSAPAGPDGTGGFVKAPNITQLVGLPYRGVAMQIQRVDWIDKYKQSLDEIANLGADTVLLIVDARQENATSTKIYLDVRVTPSVERLGELIDFAKGKKLRVILMPIVLLDDPGLKDWRGTIRPTSWAAWFDSYRDIMVHYAGVGKSHKVDMLVVGSELVSSEEHKDEWIATIAKIREGFPGQLTYSSNWDHYWSIPFWEELDLIGMNSYWSFGTKRDPQPTVEQIQAKWADIQKDLLAFVGKKNKPLLLLEVGWCSLANAAYEPWDYTKTAEKVDLDLQRRLWEGFFRSWQGNPALGGFMVWAWEPGDGGSDNKGYTPENKPAEKVIRNWMSKPWVGE